MSTPSKLHFPKLLSAVLIVLLASPALFVQATLAYPAETERVSISSAGLEGDRVSKSPSISADGRIIVFASEATNLVDGDANGFQDIFLHDWSTGTTERVTLGGQEQETNDASGWPGISADGLSVTFASTATNLVDGDENGVEDVFVVDLPSGAVECVSLTASGGQANAASSQPVISGDGRFVAFVSAATNLVPGATTGLEEIYLYDRLEGSLQWVSAPGVGSVKNDDVSGEPAISADGNWVAFSSNSTRLVPDDTEGMRDIFLWNRSSDTLERISITQTGDGANSFSYAPALNADGRFVVFRSHASDLVANDENYMGDIFLHDGLTGTLQRVNLSNTGEEAKLGPSDEPAISADGRFIVFRSYATNLVPDDTNSSADIFVRDMQGTTTRVSVDSYSGESNGNNYSPVISADGAALAFYSEANNLVLEPLEDNNDAGDVFAHGEPPTAEPTETPTTEPTDTPTAEPTESPTPEPTETPTEEPTESPTPEPTDTPTAEPTESPTPEPTPDPTEEPPTSLPPVISLKQEICVKEGEYFSLTGSFQDPDSERWTASVDYGDGTGTHELNLLSEGTFELNWVYGDNGDYTATVRIADERDSIGVAELHVLVKNQSPQVESDLLPEHMFNSDRAVSDPDPEGEAAGKIGKWYTVSAGEPAVFTVFLEDPGSDDLRVHWSFGNEAIYFNEGDEADPFPSPLGTYPFQVTHTTSVVFDKPGVRYVRVDVFDDDGAKVSMYLRVLVRGNERCRNSLGYWIHRFKTENYAELKGELRAHLSILSAFVTSSFGEFRPEVLNALEEFIIHDMDQSAHARAQLLTAWLNFTNGSVEWEDVIRDADGKHDLSYAEVLRKILAILIDREATPEELSHAIELAQSINLHFHSGSACPTFKE